MKLSQIEIGHCLPSLTAEPISRLTLALYCGASGDHNPIHVDIDYAKQVGRSDVFAHGMLSMAYLGHVLTRWVPQERLRQFSVRFVAVTQVGDALSSSGKIVEIDMAAGTARLAITSRNQAGEIKLSGEAVVELDA